MTPSQSLRLVVVAPDLADTQADDARARHLAERSRQLRIGLLQNNYNLIAVLPADTFLAERLTQLLKPAPTRRNVLQAAAVGSLGISPALRAVVYAQGSDAPEKKEVKVGFIPLTDCASIIMASVLGIDKKYGVTIVPSKEASWASIRDKVVALGW